MSYLISLIKQVGTGFHLMLTQDDISLENVFSQIANNPDNYNLLRVK